MKSDCVIIGAGHAAAQLAPALRQSGWDGSITVIGEEPLIPYHRPPLSKEFLAGKKAIDDILIRPAAVYEKAEIRFICGEHVTAIDRASKRVALASGTDLPYDRLALTVGSRVRRVDLPGSELSGIHYLRTAADVERIRVDVRPGAAAVIVGGGYIGLETAAVLRGLGMKVTVVEMMERVLQRVTAPEVSAFFTRVHSEEGVRILCSTGVSAFEGGSAVERVICSDGSALEAQIVIIGVGILPNVELAGDAGLEVDNGIIVDEYARTSDPDVVAAGDCTSHWNFRYGRRVRLESVQNATDQARVAAATICGKKEPYDALPWFWSDQYDLKLQIAGLSQGYDHVVTRGDREGSRSFAAFYLKDGEVIAVDAVNRPPEFMIGKRLIAARSRISPARLADEAVPARELVEPDS
jgi:3-phenylpropionate/trans-cinnamate dioxygenase ferredoxin reductase subunit